MSRQRRSCAALAAALALGVGTATGQRPSSEPAGLRAADENASALGRLDRAHVLDDFERDDWPDPALWTRPAPPAQTWRTSACRAASGRRALRAFWGSGAGPGSGAGEAPCNAPAVAPGASESVIELQLDLRGAATAHRLDLEFELWLGLPVATGGTGAGALFIDLLVPKGSAVEPVTVFGATGAGGAWTYPIRRLDLTALVDVSMPVDVYDLRGGLWTLRLRAVPSSPGAPSIGDVYLDDLRLVWEPDLSVPTPSPRPISSATPLPTETSTPTRRPSETPEPTPTAEPSPVALAAYLPWLARAHPSPAPSPEPSVTPTPDGSSTPTTPGPGDTPTPSASATPSASPSPTSSATPSATATPAARRFLPNVELGREPPAYPGP